MSSVSRIRLFRDRNRVPATHVFVVVLGVLAVTAIFLTQRSNVGADPKSLVVRARPLDLMTVTRVPVELNNDRFTFAMQRIARHDFRRWTQLTHGLRLWGLDSRISEKWTGERMLAIVCSADKCQSEFGIAPHILNRNGLQFGHQIVQGKPHGEKHRDETIAILAESGVPSSTPITVWDASTNVSAIVHAAALNCDLSEEIHFTAAAFAHYLPPQKAWMNKFGDTVDFDTISERLCDSALGSGGCGGCHTFFSLAAILNADGQHPILSERMRHKIRSKLSSAIELLQQTQRADGEWDTEWFNVIGKPGDDNLPAKVMVTGHTLEWLAIGPQDLVTDRGMVSRGCEAALNLIISSPEIVIEEEYNYYSHLANSLKLWCPVQWRTAKESIEASLDKSGG